MLQKIKDPFAFAQLTIDRLKKGVLLVSVDEKGQPNVMATSWGFIGYQWNKPIFTTPVRPERYSHGLILGRKEFVISVQPEDMDDDMMYCGSNSGRSVDKFQERGLGQVEIPGLSVPGVAGALLHYACRVVHTASAEPRTSHTFLFGEIAGVYVEDSSLLG